MASRLRCPSPCAIAHARDKTPDRQICRPRRIDTASRSLPVPREFLAGDVGLAIVVRNRRIERSRVPPDVAVHIHAKDHPIARNHRRRHIHRCMHGRIVNILPVAIRRPNSLIIQLNPRIDPIAQKRRPRRRRKRAVRIKLPRLPRRELLRPEHPGPRIIFPARHPVKIQRCPRFAHRRRHPQKIRLIHLQRRLPPIRERHPFPNHARMRIRDVTFGRL